MNFENKFNMHEKESDLTNRKMLSCLDVLNKIFKEENIGNWVAGGWAIDGLRGELSRDHHDIDYLVSEDSKEKLHVVLKDNGFDIENGWLDNDNNFHEFRHKIIAKKDGIDIDFVFVCFDKESGEANIKSYDKFKFPAEYLSDKKGIVKLNNNNYNFNIVSPELLLITKAEDRRNNDDEFRYLVDIIGNDNAKKIIEKYNFDYKDFRDNTI